MPGSAFGEAGEGYIRVSYAYSLEELKAATKKIRKFLENKGVISLPFFGFKTDTN